MVTKSAAISRPALITALIRARWWARYYARQGNYAEAEPWRREVKRIERELAGRKR